MKEQTLPGPADSACPLFPRRTGQLHWRRAAALRASSVTNPRTIFTWDRVFMSREGVACFIKSSTYMREDVFVSKEILEQQGLFASLPGPGVWSRASSGSANHAGGEGGGGGGEGGGEGCTHAGEGGASAIGTAAQVVWKA